MTKSVEVKNGAPATTMNTPKADLMDSVLTNSEKADVTSGTNAHIWLEVHSLNEDEVPDQDQAATDAQAKQLVGENAEITYLDISLFKQMSGQKQEQLHQSASPLSITITIPESIRTAADGMRRTFYVLRSHAENGKTVCTHISGSYDSASGAFTFETDKFSTYVLVYKDTAISSGGHSPSGPAAAYPVTVKPAANGTLQADKTSAAKGTTVTITVTPDEGYTLESLTVLDKGGNELPLTGKAGKYTFTHACRRRHGHGFFRGNWLESGLPEGQHLPHLAIYRRQNPRLVSRWRPLLPGKRPDGGLRLQSLPARCRDHPGHDRGRAVAAEPPAVAEYAVSALQWACGSGMVTGKTQGSGQVLDPKGSTTRAQMTTMMMRFCAEIGK